jgi:hypothetical protein
MKTGSSRKHQINEGVGGGVQVDKENVHLDSRYHMNSFYVANDTVVIGRLARALFSPKRPEEEEGWNLKNRRFGLGGLVQSPF